MDLSKPVFYRGLPINDLAEGTGRILKGCVIENVDYSNVQAVGYMEKRAAGDGMHASDIYLGARLIDIAGFLYQTTLPELFDVLHLMRSAFSPTGAYQASPGDRGFLPLEFSQTTMKPEWPDGVINLQILARPDANLKFNLNRDRLTDKGLVDGVPGTRTSGVRAVSCAWSVRLVAKDPRVYTTDEQEFVLGPITPTLTPSTALNRGDYETPMNIMLVVPVAPATDQTFRLTGLNGVDMTITIKAGMPPTIYRWFGDDRVLMTQATSPANSPFILRMDLVSLGSVNRKPMVPPTALNVPFSYSHSMNLAVGSRLFWSEAFA